MGPLGPEVGIVHVGREDLVLRVLVLVLRHVALEDPSQLAWYKLLIITKLLKYYVDYVLSWLPASPLLSLV